MNIRDRVKELRRVRAGDLEPNPANWRTHPKEQLDVLRGLVAEIGFAGACLAFETKSGGIRLIDGHGRVESMPPDTMIPVLILDVNEAEAKKILISFDQVSSMAGTDSAALDSLLHDVQFESESVVSMLEEMAKDADLEWTRGLDDGEPTGGQVGCEKAGEEESSQEEQESIFQVLIECETEDQQKELLEELWLRGVKVRALIV